MSERTTTSGATSSPRRLFHLKQRIGSGAYGEVFLAEQDSGAGFRRPVALKVLNATALGSHSAAQRMRDEARILGRLSHRNIVSVLDLVLLGERWAVVMDYVEGADIEQIEMALYERKEEMPPAAAFEVGAAVCRALHVAWHADDGRGGTLQVVHRDIKPSNIRLTTDGEIKVLDFGVARVELDTREAETRAEGWIGTERYMAPERILMEGDGPWGDVYAMGASVIEMILLDPLGRTPVLEHRHNPMVEAAIERVRAKLVGPPEVVDRACELLGRSVAAEPTVRPTADELSVAFAEIARKLEGETLPAFCRRFVPQVDGILGTTREAVDGVLSEGTALGSGASSASATYVADGADLPGTGEVRPSRSLAIGLGAAAVVVLLGLLVTGGAAAIVASGVVSGGWRDTGAVELPPTSPPVTVPVPATDPPDFVPANALEPEEPVGVEPQVVPEPVAPPEPVVRPPVRPRPQSAPEVVATPTPVVAANAPRVSAAAFAVQDASALTVTCGDVTQTGTASVRMREFPAGSCRVEAIYLGSKVVGTVDVTRRREVRCTVTDGRLVCGQ